MNYKELQKDLMDCVKNNSIGVLLMQFSKILVLIYPIYRIIGNFSFLSFITGIIGMFSAVLYLGYMIGLIISFAKNDMLSIGIAFGLIAVDYLIGMIMYSFSVGTILWLALYGGLAALTLYKSTISQR